jgi:hypothetical protein
VGWEEVGKVTAIRRERGVTLKKAKKPVFIYYCHINEPDAASLKEITQWNSEASSN